MIFGEKEYRSAQHLTLKETKSEPRLWILNDANAPEKAWNHPPAINIGK